jgi:hypothetical protein
MFAARAFKNEELSEYPAANIAVHAQEKKQMPSPRFSPENNVDYCTAYMTIIVTDFLKER